MELDRLQLKELLAEAWKARDRAYIFGPTAVGAAILATNGKLYHGCNIEHQFRSHDIHAEISCIAAMVSDGVKSFHVIAVVAERDRFTPCGACLDWIFQFGGGDVQVVCQNDRDGETRRFSASELMPFYPR